MKRWFANLLLRLAFRIFRRYHDQLPKELNGIIWGEIRRRDKPAKDNSRLFCWEGKGADALCSTCVREAEEDRERQEIVRRWLKGEIA